MDSVLPPSTPTAPASQPIQTRRESNRKIKKPKYDYFDDSTVATSGDVVSTTTRSDLHTPLSIQTSGGGGGGDGGADSSLSNTPAAAGSSLNRTTSNINNYQLRFCCQLIKELFSKRHLEYAWPFYKPVDVKGLGLTDYFDIIEKPMDMGTVRRKCELREYQTAAEFAADMRLIFSNCYKYNPRESDVVFMAKKLEEAFEFRYGKMQTPPPPATPTTPAGGSGGAAKQNGSGSGGGGVAAAVGKRRDSSQSTHTNKTSSPSSLSVNNLTPNSTTSKHAAKQHQQAVARADSVGSVSASKRKSNAIVNSKLGKRKNLFII